MDAVTIERLATLAVEFGANVQPDQIVTVGADLGQEEIARAIAVAAYKRGARFVEVTYFDPYVKRARIEYAREETLDFVPSWIGARVLELGRQRCARISLAGPTAPGALAGLDPARVGRDQLPMTKEGMQVVNEHTTNWTVVPAPTAPWATLVYPELGKEAALARLWRDVEHVCRLDEPDPVAAWESRAATLRDRAEKLTAAGFDALHFEGEGTDFTVGLFPSSIWVTAGDTTVDGIRHWANLPSEEVFTTPDPERAEGVVRSTRPLVLEDGTIIRGLWVRFEGGRAVEIEAEEGGGVLAARARLDEGGSRLGEVALVDRESRIGALGTVFYDTLLDENAVSHIALGDGIEEAVGEEDKPRKNRSQIHVDFMIGANDVDVTAITRDGERVALLRGGTWLL